MNLLEFGLKNPIRHLSFKIRKKSIYEVIRLNKEGKELWIEDRFLSLAEANKFIADGEEMRMATKKQLNPEEYSEDRKKAEKELMKNVKINEIKENINISGTKKKRGIAKHIAKLYVLGNIDNEKIYEVLKDIYIERSEKWLKNYIKFIIRAKKKEGQL